MSWWGLLLGGTFGFLLGGPIGALLGAAAGRLVGGALGNIEIADATGEGVERVQLAFFAAVFGVMGMSPRRTAASARRKSASPTR